MTITVIMWWMAIVCSFITSNNRTKHTHKNRYTKSTFYMSVEHEFNVSAGYRTTQSLQTTTPFTEALVDERLRTCGSFCHASTIVRSFRQLRRNFDDGRPSAEGHPRWHNQPGSNPSYSVAICRRGSTLGPGGRPPVCGWDPRFLKIFPFFITDTVIVMRWRGPGAKPPRILGLEPRLAIMFV